MGILILIPFGFMAIFSPPHELEGSWGDIGLDAPGWMLFMAGAAIRWWATLYIGGRKSNSIVTEGPYSICRNPLYLGTFLMLIGFSFYLESLTFVAGCLLGGGLYLYVTVSAEESRLREQFGQPFVDYCRAVPRFCAAVREFSLAAGNYGQCARSLVGSLPRGAVDVAAAARRNSRAVPRRGLVSSVVSHALNSQAD